MAVRTRTRTAWGANVIQAPAPGSAAKAAGETANDTPWLNPTSDFLPFDKGPGSGDNSTGSVALPAIGATATILQFTVQGGRFGRVMALGIDFIANGGAAFTPSLVPAQLVFSITQDAVTQTGGGMPAPFPDYGAFTFLPGSVILPVPIAGLMLKENQLVKVSVKNISVVVTTQFLAARLVGYFYPKRRQSPNAGFQ